MRYLLPLLLLTGCAQSVAQPRMLNATPVSACVLFCITTVEQADQEGAKVEGLGGNLAITKPVSQSATTAAGLAAGKKEEKEAPQ